jgi:hypothetical protein
MAATKQSPSTTLIAIISFVRILDLAGVVLYTKCRLLLVGRYTLAILTGVGLVAQSEYREAATNPKVVLSDNLVAASIVKLMPDGQESSISARIMLPHGSLHLSDMWSERGSHHLAKSAR